MPPIEKFHEGNADAPETAHILWTTPYAAGGLTGGEQGDMGYEMGDAYVGKFAGSVVINARPLLQRIPTNRRYSG
jgi:hypothetical protein